MSLPEGFFTNAEYFNAAVHFLREYRWLYYYPNTDILAANVLDCMPEEWCLFFEENKEPSVDSLRLWEGCEAAPESLNTFLKIVNQLTPHYKTTQYPKIQLEHSKGLGLKKQHEISLLAPLILNICKEHNINYVVDIGCGLGYLTNLLHNNGLKILGIDGNPKFVQTAREKYPDINFEELYVTANSTKFILGYLKTHFNEFNQNIHNVCLVALHACADLTIDVLNLSMGSDCYKMSAVMPCCYHRMKHKLDGNGVDQSGFVNFPLSNDLKSVIETRSNNKEDGLFLNGTFLRLACQGADWKKQNDESRNIQTNNLMFRNVLQYVVAKENLRVQRQRRKTGSNRGDYTIDDFLTNLATSYTITSHRPEENGKEGAQPIGAAHFERIAAAVRQNYARNFAHKRAALAAFVALQNRIQPVCENLVLLDRCAFVGQSPDAHCSALKVTDECVSPRCFALLVTKSNTPPSKHNLRTRLLG